MKRILSISFAVCLIGAMSSLYYGTDQGTSIQRGGVFITAGDSLIGEQDTSIISGSYLVLLFAEINHDLPSEIDPKKSFSANWSANQYPPPLQFQYLIRAQRHLISQSVRNLIYPFHSFL